VTRFKWECDFFLHENSLKFTKVNIFPEMAFLQKSIHFYARILIVSDTVFL